MVLDGSFGQSGALPGPNFIITSTMGRQIGPNLFHSFSDFNLTSSESATFTGPASVQNIIARVTGGSASSIDGTINSQIAGANLFLLNPAGIMFGPNATVNVTGSFVVGTADNVQLADGGKFNTSLGDDSQLTSAAVSAFGFLSPSPQPVSFAGTQLSVRTGAGLHVIAGDITLDQGTPNGGVAQGTALSAPSGFLTLFSAASVGQVPFSLASPGTGFASATNPRFGNIAIQGGSSAAIDGVGGGSVIIRGGKITVNNSTVTSFNYGAIVGGNISIQADSMNVQNNGVIGTDSEPGSTAGAGSVTADVAEDLTVATGAEISANTETNADGGSVTLAAGGNIGLETGGAIVAATDGGGNSGSILAHARSLDISAGQSGFSSHSEGAGHAGDIDLDIAGTITMTGDSSIAANADNAGDGGTILVQALRLSMSDTAVISADTTFGTGNGGNITVKTGSLSIQGTGSLVQAFGTFLIGTTGITAESFSPR